MYCPRCSQEQVAEDLIFCSACGLRLDSISEFVENGGDRGRSREPEQTNTVFTRRNGLLVSLVWLLLVGFCLPALIILDGATYELIIFVALQGFFWALVLAVISLFLKSPEQKTDVENRSAKNIGGSHFGAIKKVGELESGKFVPAHEYVSPVTNIGSYETGDMPPASSVVEKTTKLLRKERIK